jgi:hypothetical protein
MPTQLCIGFRFVRIVFIKSRGGRGEFNVWTDFFPQQIIIFFRKDIDDDDDYEDECYDFQDELFNCLMDRQRENCFLTKVESKFLPDFRINMPKTSSDRLDFYLSGPTYFDMCRL